MATYILPFDPTGRTHENFQVPKGKRVYIVRAPQVAQGTATVHDLISLEQYTIPNGVTICETSIPPGADVSLAFMARSNPNILAVNVEVISPRTGINPCG